jgi:hypothetical protein
VINPPNTEQIQAVVIFIYKITILGDKGRVYFFKKRIADWPYKKRRGGYTDGGEKQGKTEERDFGFPS